MPVNIGFNAFDGKGNVIHNYQQMFSNASTDKATFDASQTNVFDSFNGAKSIPFTMPNPNMTARQAAFSEQFGQWQNLRSALNNNGSAKLLAYDLETLAANPFDALTPITNNTAITELGITSGIIHGGKLQRTTSNSIAGGIDIDQLTSYLDIINRGSTQQLTDFSESRMASSLLDRLSRYSGDITDRFSMGTVRWQRDLLLVNSLASPNITDINAVHEGLRNLAIAGGVTQEQYLKAYSGIKTELLGGFDPRTFGTASESFASSGLKSQLLSTKDTTTAKKIAKIFSPIDNDTFGINFNGDSFDNPIMSGILGITPNRRRSLDLRTAIMQANPKSQYNTTLEGLSEILGMPIDAHYAASDTMATLQAAVNTDLFELGQNVKAKSTNVIGKTLYSKKSLAYTPNADYIEDGNRFYRSAVEKGKLYTIEEGGIRQLEDGKFAVEFTALGNGRKSIKQFGSAQEVENALRSSFDFLMNEEKLRPENVESIAKNIDIIKDADKARRNFDDMFTIRSIEGKYDSATKTISYIGGFDRLNKTYDAYLNIAKAISQEGPGNVSEDLIKKVAESTEYDDAIEKVLLGYGDTFAYDGRVYASSMRDIKAMFGRLNDDSFVLGKIIDAVNSHNEWDIHQKTMASGHIYNGIRDQLFRLKNTSYVSSSDTFANSVRTADDMFSVVLGKENGSNIRLNFSDLDTTADSLRRYARKGSSNNIEALSRLDDVAAQLKQNGIISEGALLGFRNEVFKGGIRDNGTKLLESDVKIANYAQRLAEDIDRNFTQRIKSSGFTLEDFLAGDSSKLTRELAKTVFEKETIGTEILSQTRADRYRIGEDLTEYSLNDFFKNVDVASSYLDKTISDTERLISNTSTTISSQSELIPTLMNKMGYEPAAAEEMSRLLFASNGLASMRVSGTNKTEFITTFAYDEGSKEAFVLLNKSNDMSGLQRTTEILNGELGDTSTLGQKIASIKEEGTSGVISIPFVNKQDVGTGIASDLKINRGNVTDPKTFRTISIGDKGFEKIGQYKIGQYISEEYGSYRRPLDVDKAGIEHIDLSITDNTTEFMKNLRKVRRSFGTIAEDASLSNSEVYGAITRKANRSLNQIISDMPGPSGFQPWKSSEGVWQKKLIPNIADISQSSQIDIKPLQGLALRTAEQANDSTVYKIFSGLLGTTSPSEYKKAVDEIIETGKAPSEFKEYFLKHLSSVPMSDSGVGPNMSILQWMKEGADSGQFRYTEGTKEVLNFLTNNSISQIIKEKATGDMKVALLDLTAVNRYGMLDAMQRPTNTQQGTALSYKMSDAIEQLGSNAEKLDITLGYEAISNTRADLLTDRARILAEEGIVEPVGDTITGNLKQMHSLEISSRYKDLQNVLDETFSDTLMKYSGLTDAQRHDLIQEAFDIMQRTSSSTYESRMILRPSLGQLDYFTTPSLKKASIDALDEIDIKRIYNFNINSTEIKSGQVFKDITGEFIARYNGPSGRLSGGTIGDLLRSGEDYLIEEVQGVRSQKIYLGNEKGMAYVHEFDTSSIYERFRQIAGNRKDAKQMYYDLADSIFDKVFGSKTSIVADLEVNKHLSGSAVYGGMLDTILFGAKKTGQEQTVVDILNAARLNNEGLEFAFKDGKFIYNIDTMGKTGVYSQIERTRAAILRSEKLGPLASIIKDYEANGYIRTNISVGINNESMGEEMFLDPRSKTAFGSQGIQNETQLKKLTGDPNLDFNVIESNGQMRYYQDYILDSIENESLERFGRLNPEYEKTVQGLLMANDAKQVRNQLILDVKLADVNLIDSGTDISEALKSGIIKTTINKNGKNQVVYSQTLKNLAEQQGKDVRNISALRITDIDDGFIMPLFMTNNVDGKTQYIQSQATTQRFLEAVKNYGKNKGYIEDKRLIDNLRKETLTSYVTDLNFKEKTSYIYKNLERTRMANSGMFSADLAYTPDINGITDNMDLFLSKTAEGSAYRESLINAIKSGKGDNIVYRNLNNSLLTIKQGGKTKYLDVVEFSREGFERLGVNFNATGADILINPSQYKHIVKGLDNSFIDQLQDAQYLAKRLAEYGITDEATLALVNNREALVDALNKANKGDFLSNITSDYLEQVGTFGINLRHPTFHEGSISTTLVRLNRTLGRDDITYTGPLMRKLHLDFDADKTMAKIFANENGVLINQTQGELFSALSKSYNTAIQSNNMHMAKLVKSMAKKVESSVGHVSTDGTIRATLTDVMLNSMDFKAAMLKESITSAERTGLYEGLTPEIAGEIEEFVTGDTRNQLSAPAKEAFDEVFKRFDVSFGNARLNQSLQRSAIKAKSIKEEIGVVSNANFKVNQMIDTLSKQAFYNQDEGLMQTIKEIKTALHVEDLGFLPESEQGAISVKHVYDSLSTTQISKYSSGMNKIFGGNVEEGILDLREALKTSSVSQESLETGFDALRKLSGISGASAMWKGLDKSTSYNNSLKFLEGFDTQTSKELRKVFDNLNSVKRNGYEINGVFQELKLEDYYVSNSEGRPILYRYLGDNNDGMLFKRYTINKNGTSVLDDFTIKETGESRNAVLQSLFGGFGKEGYTDTALTKTSVIDEITGRAVALRQLDLFKQSSDYNMLLNRLKYIDSHRNILAKGKAFDPNDVLTEINQAIIEKGSKKKASFIVDETLAGYLNSGDLSLLDSIGSYRETPDLFEGFDEAIKDVSGMRRNIKQANAEATDEIINKYLKNVEATNNKLTNTIMGKIMAFDQNSMLTRSDINKMFNLSEITGESRVAFGDELLGRRFSTLTQSDIDNILGYAFEGSDNVQRQLFEATQDSIKQYITNANIPTSSGIDTVSDEMLTAINEEIKAAGQRAEKDIADIAQENSRKIADTVNDLFSRGKEFVMEHPRGSIAAGAVLGLSMIGNMFSGSKNSSPLAENVDKSVKPVKGVINNDKQETSLAPRSIKPPVTSAKPVYVNGQSGVQFRMSAKSRNILDKEDVARQLININGGSTDITVKDDRTRISNNWLERKFSDLV